MADSGPVCINDIVTLQERLTCSEFGVHWQINPEEGQNIRLTPSILHLFIDGIPVSECPLVESFKQFLCNAIGEIEHCPGTTLTADGVLTLSSFLSQRMLDINFDYAEFPSIVGSSDGCCRITTPLFEFLAIHEKGG